MNDFTENALRENCPHCDPKSFALKYPLYETNNFWIVCDVHPLTEGHVLIIPKKHLSCIGEYPTEILNDYVKLHEVFTNFVKDSYNYVSTFEHGKIGQTVFHSHVHIFPFNGKPEQIVPEGKNNLRPLKNINQLKNVFNKENQYLYFSIENNLYTVNPKLGAPRFFRDRFAKAMNVPERGNWKEMDSDKNLMENAIKEMVNLQKTWTSYSKQKHI